MIKILVVHGAGMRLRGKVQVDRFGPMTLADYELHIGRYASELGVEVEMFGSSSEGEVIEKLYDSHEGDVDAAVINPAGFMRGYPALTAAIEQVRFPTIEVHVTNPASREIDSEVARGCRGVVTGFGVFGYYLDMRGAVSLLDAESGAGAG